MIKFQHKYELVFSREDNPDREIHTSYSYTSLEQAKQMLEESRHRIAENGNPFGMTYWLEYQKTFTEKLDD